MSLILIFTILVICALLARKLFYKPKLQLLTNRHVIITGGSSGIGKSVATECAKLGAKVTIIARDIEKMKQARDEILETCKFGTVQYLSVDLCSKYENVEEAIRLAEEEFGPTFMLVNCAGMAVCGKFEDISMDDVKHIMNLNYLGTVCAIRAVLPEMKSRREGIIVITSSIAGILGLFGYGAYSASKFAVRGLAECLAMECQQYGIKVTVCLPPDTDTPGFANENRSKPLETKLLSEAGGLVKPEVVAKQLLSDALKGEYYSTVGIEGLLLGLLCSGAGPGFGPVLLPLQTLLMGPLRFFIWCMHVHFKSIIKKCTAQRDDNKKSD